MKNITLSADEKLIEADFQAMVESEFNKMINIYSQEI